MSNVHLHLISRLNAVGSDGLASAVRRCIREGVTGKQDLAHIAGAVLRQLPYLGIQDTTSILAGLAKVHYRNFQLFSALVERLGQVGEIPLKEASVLLHSFSKIHFNNSDLTAKCADVVKSNIDAIRPKEAAKLLHALTKLRYEDAALLSGLVASTQQHLTDLDDCSLANFVIGCAKITVSDKTIALICQELTARAGTLGPLEALRSLLALVHFKAHKDANATSNNIVKTLNCNLLSLLQLTLVLESVAALGSQGAQRISAALLRKRDTYATVPPDLDSRIQAALAAVAVGQRDESPSGE